MFIGEQKNSERQKDEIRKIDIVFLILSHWCNSLPEYAENALQIKLYIIM